MTGHPLFQLVLFRFREFFRQPDVIFWALIFPLVLMVVLGLAFRPQPAEPVPILVAVAPGDARAEAAAAALARSPDVRARALPPELAALAHARGEAAVLVIPDEPPTYRFDPGHPEARTARLVADRALQAARGRRDAFEPKDETVAALGARYIDWFVPGLLGMAVMNGCLWGIGFSLVEMRSNKLLKRFAVTPMKRGHFLLATAIHRVTIVVLEGSLMLVFSGLAFGFRVQGSLLAYGLVATVGTATFAGIALLVAARPSKTEVAAGLMNIPMLPQMVLSGVFFSSTKFPDWLQPFVRALPLTALNDALRRIANEGGGLADVGRELALLVAWAALTGVLALKLFRWT